MVQSAPTSISGSINSLRSPSETVSTFLANFALRQSLLQAIRGCAMAVVMFFCGLNLIVAIDWANHLHEAWRGLLTCSLYVCTLLAGWHFGLKRFFFPASVEIVARSVEHLHPNLQESLLATVELKRPDGTSRSGSAVFVNAIEHNVAQELNELDIRILLPMRTTAISVLAMLTVIALVLVTRCMPNIKFAERLGRAMVPFISSERRSNSQFTNTDSSPIARPKVFAFHFTVKPPPYALSQTVKTTETRGDLCALKGSRVQWDIDVNQKLSKASIAMEFTASGRKEVVVLRLAQPDESHPLVPFAVQRFTTDLVIEEAATYHMRLVSDRDYQTNPIENTYSPRYKITAVEDSVPIISWLASDKTIWNEPPKPNQEFIVAPDEIVSLSAIISDNLPFEKLFQEASVNLGPWVTVQQIPTHSEFGITKSIEHTGGPAFSAQADWAWDLGSLGASSGDSISTRVTAIDRKGNTNHSLAIQLNLAIVGFDRNRHNSLYRRSELVPKLAELSASLNKSRDQLRPQMERLKDVDFPIVQRVKLVEDIRTMIVASTTAAQATRALALRTIKEIGRCVDQAEVELTARLVSRIEKEWLATMRFCVEAPLPQSNSNSDAESTAWHRKDYEQRIKRLLHAYDSACDNSMRGLDIYQQFIGNELQASLTLDLTNLYDLQQDILKGSPTDYADDSIFLARSQKIAHQHIDAIVKLAKDIEPNLNQDCKSSLGELYRKMELSRTETTELAEQDLTEQAGASRTQSKSNGDETIAANFASSSQLRNRIERGLIELKNMRWAFNLHETLSDDVNRHRQELLTRSGSLWQIFERFANRHQVRNEANNDKTLATDDLLSRNEKIQSEVTQTLLSSLGQMLDRRDIHQRRSINDAMHASDIGMAYRAWTIVLARWVAEPANASSHFSNVQAITNAYRILEAAHETVEARLVVQSLVPIEQYEWRSLEAQLMNPRQWESVHVRLEVAIQWMREARFPNSVVEMYNELRSSEPAQRVRVKLNPRRSANNTNLVSSADDLRSLLLLWAAADREAKPILDEARATLAKFSPTVSELAKQAAVATQELKQLTEQLENNANRSGSIPLQDRMQHERKMSQTRISQLQDALIELAGRQDLLQKAELDFARDSDRALKLLNAVLPAMNDAIDVAMKAAKEGMAEQSEKAKEAVKREAEAITAFERIADHFALLDEPSKATEASRELAQSGAELERMALNSPKQQPLMTDSFSIRDETEDYKKADELEALAKSEPESLLARLEKVLKRNRPMQQELSEISKNNVQSMANELQNAARTEKSLARQLENADARLAGDKRLIFDQLTVAAEKAERFATKLLSKAAQAALKTGINEQATYIEQAANDLVLALKSARKLGDEVPRRVIESASQELADRLDHSQVHVEKAYEVILPFVEQLTDKDERKKQDIRVDAQNTQNQIRNEILHQTRELATQSLQRNEQAAKRLKQSQADLDIAHERRQSAKSNLKQSPNNETALEFLREATSHFEQALVKKQADEKIAVQADRLAKQSREQMGVYEQAERASLDRPNPRAALAIEQLELAKEQLTQLQEQVNSIVDATKRLPSPETPASILFMEEKEQQQIQEVVLDVSVQLARSGRHEKRLGNTQDAMALSSHSESIETVARGSLDQAKKELNRIAKKTKLIEQQHSDATNAEEAFVPFVPFARPVTDSAQYKLINAAQDLTDLSKRIEEQFVMMVGSKRQSPNASSSSDENKLALRDMNQSEARDMARLLDILDRQLNSEAHGAFEDSVKASAEKLASAMSQQRLDQRSASQSNEDSRNESRRKRSQSSFPGSDLSSFENEGELILPGMTRFPNRDWGKLRNQGAEDAVEGRRDEYDPEFSQSIQVYFKAIGNQ